MTRHKSGTNRKPHGTVNVGVPLGATLGVTLGVVVGAAVALVATLITVSDAIGQAAPQSGYLSRGGERIFPIGSYELPSQDADLAAMGRHGINLVRCGNRTDLDRAQAAGVLGWVSLGITSGPTADLRRQIVALRDHPALAVWEGPDEIVWNFTAYSGLAKTAGFTREDWRNQTPKAVAYARERAADLMPKMNAAIALVRELDQSDRPFWINEAGRSDVKYCRQYMDSIDITGCDYYAVRPTHTDLEAIGRMTRRWSLAGRGRPVWMVLQAFSWHKANPARYFEPRHPTFAETRFMAYDAIVHGARGIMYWGSFLIEVPAFRQSIYALTAELAALQPFLVQPDEDGVTVTLIEAPRDDRVQRGVRASVRRRGDDWLVILVNEDNYRHLAVEVTGLEALSGRDLVLLYGDEKERIQRGELLTRMQAYETKVFATSRNFETKLTEGRDFLMR